MTSLLLTKFYAPSLRPGLVRRPRLIDRLDEGLASGSTLTLISAPAGFGKTTLIAEWLENVERPRTWLSLDADDNDPARFLAYLLAALQQIDASIGQTAQGILSGQPHPPWPEALMVSLINEIEATPTPFFLVLDDYHLVHTLAVHQQLTVLLEHQPRHMHLVLISREDPPMPVSRLRARGQMTDIRQADLRFTEEEAAAFIHCTMGLNLSPTHLAALCRRTEGWIAGLQLVAMSLRGRNDVQQLIASFAGSNRYVLDYLVEEVFSQQPPHVQDFMLRTSILDRFTALLCDAVTGREDSREMLLTLERANLFLVPLDQSREWYRYHHLFGDLLRHRLQIEQVELEPKLHRLAARWYAANGLPQEAVRHALAAADWEAAADLIAAANGELLMRGQMMTLLSWFRALPEPFLRSRPDLCYGYAWPLLLNAEIDAAESYLAQAEQSEEWMRAFPGNIFSARGYIALIRGDGRRAMELSQQALIYLPQDDFVARSVVATNLGRAYWYAGRLAQADQVLAEAQRSALRSGNAYARVTAEIFGARVQAAWGRLDQAVAAYRRTIEGGGRMPVVAGAHADLARLLYERNDLEAAAEHLRQGLALSRQTGNIEFQMTNLRTLSLVRQAQGDADAVREALEEDLQLIQHAGIPSFSRLHALAYHALTALNGSDPQTAAQLLEQSRRWAESSSVPDYVLLSLAQVRLLLAQDERAAAAELLEAREAKLGPAGFHWATVETRALQALAASTREQALGRLEQALTLAEPGGFIRTFVDLGEAMRSLLLAFLTQRTADPSVQAYARKLLAVFSLPESRTQASKPAAGGPSPPDLLEPLSERELDVLRLLSEGQTNHEMARALHLSINTIKTHVSSLYGKLGVHGRRQAVAQARNLGFLE